MSVTLREVVTKSDLKKFIKFPFDLYKGNPYYVPPLLKFELSTLSKDINPAFDHCQSKMFLAYKNDWLVGRICGIILDDEKNHDQRMRFGWIDFIDDRAVSEALLIGVINWGKEHGINAIHGPMGFTDLDFEGMLVEGGFETLATQVSIYNYPYYQDHMEALGFTKACDWIDGRGRVPKEMPRKLARSASLISSRFNLHSKKFKSSKELLAYGEQIFDVLNKSFTQLYAYHPLSDKQIKYYIKLYFGMIRPEFINVIVNENDEVIAFGISLPSLSRALQKAKGSLFPFGFIHILRAFYSSKEVDMILIAVDPEYQKLGASALMFHDLLQNYQAKGVELLASAHMMEENRGVMNLWTEFKESIIKMDIIRRVYIKKISK